MEPTMITELHVFTAEFVEKGSYHLLRGEYAYGGTAIMAKDAETGEPAFVVSVYLDGLVPGDEHTFWAKTWSENSGIVEELVERGIIRLTGFEMPTGFAIAQEAVICEEYR